MRLNQLLAIEKQVKDNANGALTGAYHDAQKGALFDGFTRTYSPVEEGGEVFPPEEKVLQARIHEVLRTASAKTGELLDLTARKDLANCAARASVVLDDGAVLIADMPATYLLWLEKKLIDLRTFTTKLPKLSADERWTWSDEQNCYMAPATLSAKTKKFNVPVTLSVATKEHPAQVAMGSEDKTIGHWSTVKYSGALPATKVAVYLERLDKLIAAVKQARQKANSVECPSVDPIGSKVLGFIFG